MVTSFAAIKDRVLAGGGNGKIIALAGAHDPDALRAVVTARRTGVARAVLIGRVEEIRRLLRELGEQPEDYRVEAGESEQQCAHAACRLVLSGQAHIPMKGLMQTSSFMRALLSKEYGFVPDKALISHCIVAQDTRRSRLFLVTDCVINIAPGYEDKVKLIRNAVQVARGLGCGLPKVAVVAPVEVVNPAMSSTVEAAMLSKANQRGQIPDCVVDGPLGLDNAASLEAAQHKGIESPVAGQADILVMPDIGAGNIFAKSLIYYAGFPNAGAVAGTTVPVVMTSRTDSPEDKYRSILCAVLLAS